MPSTGLDSRAVGAEHCDEASFTVTTVTVDTIADFFGRAILDRREFCTGCRPRSLRDDRIEHIDRRWRQGWDADWLAAQPQPLCRRMLVRRTKPPSASANVRKHRQHSKATDAKKSGKRLQGNRIPFG